MTEGFKPCPFCGSEDYELATTDFLRVFMATMQCKSCRASVDVGLPCSHTSADSAIDELKAKWNTRTDNTQAMQLIVKAARELHEAYGDEAAEFQAYRALHCALIDYDLKQLKGAR